MEIGGNAASLHLLRFAFNSQCLKLVFREKFSKILIFLTSGLETPMSPLYYLSSSLVLRLQKEFHMFFSIDANNGVAIYEQIVRQVKFAIAEESLRPGQLLPSVRTLSVQLALNPNTIARAYQQLQSDGVLESLRGRGLAVCQGATKACREERRSIIADRLQSVLTEALHGGLTATEIEDIVRKQLKKLTPTVNTVSSTVPSQPTA